MLELLLYNDVHHCVFVLIMSVLIHIDILLESGPEAKSCKQLQQLSKTLHIMNIYLFISQLTDNISVVYWLSTHWFGECSPTNTYELSVHH